MKNLNARLILFFDDLYLFHFSFSDVNSGSNSVFNCKISPCTFFCEILKTTKMIINPFAGLPMFWKIEVTFAVVLTHLISKIRVDVNLDETKTISSRRMSWDDRFFTWFEGVLAIWMISKLIKTIICLHVNSISRWIFQVWVLDISST